VRRSPTGSAVRLLSQETPVGVEPTVAPLCRRPAKPFGGSVNRMRIGCHSERSEESPRLVAPRPFAALRATSLTPHAAFHTPNSAFQASSPGIEPGLRPSRGRVRCPPHPEDHVDVGRISNPSCHVSTPPRNRTSSCSFERCHAFRHTRGRLRHSAAAFENGCTWPWRIVSPRSASRPGLEPGPGPSDGPMRSATPSGQSSRLTP
jgi:hypothetical protein